MTTPAGHFFQNAPDMKNMNMRNFLLLAALLTALALPTKAADALSETLQKALLEEEANHNLDAAIKAYQSVLQQTDDQRKLAATAIFRLVECYLKLGRTNDATGQYQRILQEFSDQTTLADLSRQNLVGMGAVPKALPGQVLSRAARMEQKQLLEQEIALADQELKQVTELVKKNLASQSSLFPLQRDVLGLRRQVAALDLGVNELSGGAESSG